MAYNENIPDLDHSERQDSQILQQNAVQVKTSWGVNHTVLGGAADEGKHVKLDLTDQHAVIPITSIADGVTLYADMGELYMSKNAGAAFSLTGATLAATGRCKLPCGLEMKWGTGTIAVGSKTSVVMFVAAFTNNCFSVQITPTSVFSGRTEDYVLGAVGTAKAGYVATRKDSFIGTAAGFTWLAIGD